MKWCPAIHCDRFHSTLARELYNLLQNRSVEPPYLLIGHSYGGMVAQHFAHQHPEQVRGMVLIDPAHERLFYKFPWDFAISLTCAVPTVLRTYQAIACTGFLELLDQLGLFIFPPLLISRRRRLDTPSLCQAVLCT